MTIAVPSLPTVIKFHRRNDPGAAFGLPPAIVHTMSPFEYVAGDLARTGEPGIHDETCGDGRVVVMTPLGRTPARIFILAARNERGRVVGHLSYYPEGVISRYKPGEYSMNVWLGARRQGVGLALLTEADRRWDLDFTIQKYTEAGRALVVKYLTGKTAAAPRARVETKRRGVVVAH